VFAEKLHAIFNNQDKSGGYKAIFWGTLFLGVVTVLLLTMVEAGIAIALIVLVLAAIFIYNRTQIQPTLSGKTYNQAVELAKRGNYKEAIETFTQLLRINPKFIAAYIERGVARSSIRDKQGAIEDFTQALRIAPNFVEVYIARGNARFYLGDKQGAIEDYNQAIRINPNYADAYYHRGNVRADLGDQPGAVEEYRKAVKLFFDQGDLANYRRALDNLKQVQLKPTIPIDDVKTKNKPQPSSTMVISQTAIMAENVFNQGLNKAKNGDYIGAIENFSQALRLNAQYDQAYYNRGLGRFKLGANQEAIIDLTQALRLNPDHAEAYVCRGNAYRKQGDNQGAVMDYTQVLRIFPNDAKAYYNRGVAYSESADKQKAIEDYQKAVKLYYEQGDEVNCKRALDNLKKLQPQAMPPKSVGKAIPSKPSPRPSPKRQENKIRFDQASRELQNKLMNLLHGDRELAIRLLSQVKTNNPDRSIDWYFEKVIYDLERDRSR
jgi:tetratricopeptide (TPR) repeat protein